MLETINTTLLISAALLMIYLFFCVCVLFFSLRAQSPSGVQWDGLDLPRTNDQLLEIKNGLKLPGTSMTTGRPLREANLLRHSGATSSFPSWDVCQPDDDERPEVMDQFGNIQIPEEVTLLKRKGPKMDVSRRQQHETHQDVSSYWVPVQDECSWVTGSITANVLFLGVR